MKTEEGKKPVSYVAKKTKEMMDNSMSELGGLDETSIKALHFFLKEVAGIPFYKIDILYKTDPKQIVISVFDTHGRPFYVKPKQDEIFKALAVKIGVPNYVIRFAKREEVHGS